jgi:protein-tyrosine phosphatase
MAELLFRSWLPSGADVAVSSAGVQALVGSGIDHSSASALGQLGVDPRQHRARQFEPWMAAEADLILTAERAHRDQVMTELPSAFRRTFTMKEFARLSRHVESGNPNEVIADIAAIRGIDGPVPELDDNMPDPYRGMIKQANSIAQQVSETVRATIAVLDLTAEQATTSAAQAAGAVRVPSRTRPLPR